MLRWIALLTLLALPAHAEVLSAWVEMTGGQGAEARAVVTGDDCPSIVIAGATTPMRVRAPRSAAFPLVCATPVPLGPGRADIGGISLRLPSATPQRIIAFGDTGCRILGHKAQACNDPIAYPPERLARLSATLSPDLVIHVGDYYYREVQCPAGNAGCAGSPYGDTWPAWEADFFGPEAALLQSAPFVLVRGNHESCGRGAAGWFTLLDPRPYDPEAAACRPGSKDDFTPPYLVTAADPALLVFDSSYAADNIGDPQAVAAYRREMDATLPTIADRQAVFVTHRPTLGMFERVGGAIGGGNVNLQTLFADGVPAPIVALLSGHIHAFQVVALDDGRYPPQFVVGDGGTALDPVLVPDATAGDPYAMAPGRQAPLLTGIDEAQFGITVFDRTPEGSLATFYDDAGQVRQHCTLRIPARQVTCGS